MTLHFFEDRVAQAFIATCRELGIPNVHEKTEEAPRHHVTAQCVDEKQKKALTEEWGKRSIIRQN